jgi:DNA gyrase subunit A
MAEGAGEKIITVNIEEEMKSAYIDYSMSVIVSRALPDVRDGLKPVHRRVLYGMLDLGVTANKSHKKSARIVGEVLGKYHPHGDTSVYDTMVRMAQSWSLRYPLVDGQGNFGSVDGDSPAAMRYTEAKLRKIAEELLNDLEKDTVDFRPNFDDSLQEPTVLPSRIPNLLVNGSSGIAVGMATNMPPHNLTEVIDGTMAYIDNRDIDTEGLMQFVKAPDFPTGGIIYGYEGVKLAFETGKGRIVMRAKTRFEENNNGREVLIVEEIPYQVNKAEMIRKTAELVNDKKIEGISDIRDESDRNGMRIVYELKRDCIPNVVLNKLFKYTALQTSFSVNNIALVDGRPEMLNLKQMIHHFVEHRHEVVIRRTRFDLRKAEERAHILEGLIIASDNIDEVIEIIKASKNTEDARERLITRFELSDLQSRAIVEMRLRQLTGLEQDKLRTEYAEIMELITDLKDILENEERRMQIIKDELMEIRNKYGDERMTAIEYSASEMRIEDLIPNDEVVITISHAGYIKRTSLSEYKVQNRGGVGSKGSTTRDQDFLEHLFVANNHNYLLVFTEKGRCFWMRVFEVPQGSKTSKGRAIQNLINIEQDDKVMAYINVQDLKDEEYVKGNYIVMCTKLGVIKKTTLEAYSRPRTNGINAIGIREGDQLLEAKLTNGENEIILASSSGRAIRFNETTVRPMGRTASGVRGITLGGPKDQVIGMVCVEDVTTSILVVSEKGYGKRSFLNDPEDGEPIYRITNRGGKGVKTLNVTDKTGGLIAIKNVTDDDDLMIINKSGIAIRMHVADLRVMGRATQGVRLISLRGNDAIAAVAKVDRSDEEEFFLMDEEGNMILDDLGNPTLIEMQRDEEGTLIYDEEGNPIPVVENEEGTEEASDNIEKIVAAATEGADEAPASDDSAEDGEAEGDDEPEGPADAPDETPAD